MANFINDTDNYDSSQRTQVTITVKPTEKNTTHTLCIQAESVEGIAKIVDNCIFHKCFVHYFQVSSTYSGDTRYLY